jgi:hypothetical protein
MATTTKTIQLNPTAHAAPHSTTHWTDQKSSTLGISNLGGGLDRGPLGCGSRNPSNPSNPTGIAKNSILSRMGVMALSGVALALFGCARPEPALSPEQSAELANAADAKASEAQALARFIQTGQSTLVILDADDRTPLAGVRVMVGDREGSPFQGNVLTTGASGEVLVPADWTAAAPVTIDGAKSVRTSFMSVVPTPRLELLVREARAPRRLELKGKTTGFGTLQQDGIADVGMVFPALQRSELSRLQISSLISPEMDSITVLGRTVELPSNLTLPQQTESYIFPITLDKPSYRMYFQNSGTQKVTAAHAQFPFREVVDSARSGASPFDLLKYITFKGASVRDVRISSSTQSADLTVDSISFGSTIPFTAPNFSASNQRLLAIALMSTGGVLIPTDIKSVDPRQSLNLTSSGRSSQALVVSMLRESNNQATAGAKSEEFSATIQKGNQSSGLEPLPLIQAPSFRNSVLTLSPPRNPRGLSDVMTYAALNKIQSVGSGSTKLDVKELEWEVYAPGWMSRIDLPQMPGSSVPRQNRRWEAAFLGEPSGGQTPPVGPEALNDITHVTRSAVDL